MLHLCCSLILFTDGVDELGLATLLHYAVVLLNDGMALADSCR